MLPDSNHIHAAWHACLAGNPRGAGLYVACRPPTQQFSTSKLEEVPNLLRKAHAASKQGAYVVGGLTYEAAPALDPALPGCAGAPGLPLAVFLVFDPAAVQFFDDATLFNTDLVCTALESPWAMRTSTGLALDQIEQVRQAIAQGDFYQINLTTRLIASTSASPAALWPLFLALYKAQPAERSLYLRGQSFTVLSLSPELFFSWETGRLWSAPMKGTRKPGDASASQLSDSEKDQAENVMIVDLLRNDMAKVCKPRSVRVSALFEVMRLPTVEQMTSTIEGQTEESTDVVDVFAALFPCGSVTGAPKRQAMLRIQALEQGPRGFYCAALGVMRPGGDMQFNVPIRTVVAQLQGDGTSALDYGVGSGVTWYSDPFAELQEWWQKTEFLRQVCGGFEVLETVRLQAGVWQHLELHLERMLHSARHFGFAVHAEVKGKFRQQLLEVAREASIGLDNEEALRGRWLLNPGGNLTVQCLPMPPTPQHVRLVLARQPIVCHPQWLLHKTTFRTPYEQFDAIRGDAFDVLLTNTNGLLSETCRGNLVIELHGRCLTPTLQQTTGSNFLPGVHRQLLLRDNTVQEAALKPQDLQDASRIWVCNSLRGMVPVAQIVDEQGAVLFSSK